MLLNKTREKVERGEVTYGTLLSFPSTDLVRFYGLVGYDWVFIDAEHDPVSPETVARLVEACHLVGITPFVRVPESTPGTILRYLEAGAMGIIVPHLGAAADAQAAADAVRFGPDGQRGAGSTGRTNDFGLTRTPAEYFAAANSTLWVWGLVEDEPGIDHLDEILAVGGLDVVGVGPGDLAMSLGMRGQAGDPKVRALVEKADRRIARSGKHLMSLVITPEDNAAAVARGARLILTNATPLLARACRAFLADLKAATK
ncbi:MAG TPA: aldolase/citrate lyase family protein [Candidatus Limnocylindria bacterium]|nr:aldolase/citrate lyase family protein [Candidatus Limnocylindria bacterium]